LKLQQETKQVYQKLHFKRIPRDESIINHVDEKNKSLMNKEKFFKDDAKEKS
jgi:hypothetical protein